MIVAVCGGFLLAVLWMDLMFDVQVLRHRGAPVLPDDVLASIATYYRRVTTTARPMGHLVGTVMVVMLTAIVLRRDVFALALAAPPVALAAFRVVPNAVRLGTRADPPERQSELARAIFRDHVFCFGAIAALVARTLAS